MDFNFCVKIHFFVRNKVYSISWEGKGDYAIIISQEKWCLRNEMDDRKKIG
ncbi:hypothetical protein BBR01nite_56260 [Brevibacillus brevis]|nr:hypothetical protein FB479_109226 [Brevibacillus sp. AG162]GEC93295.1 hypothetical protein BBR01nite_56260 [Brevibacillus brevis]VEF91395.1 Uncharacterised protein [Brevibacillus brevis]